MTIEDILSNLSLAEVDEALRRVETPKCAKDICYFVDRYCKTYDPRLLAEGKSATIDFKLFPKQREYLLWIDDKVRNRKSGLVEKSRDMGITWLSCAYALHGLLFKPGFSAGFGSRKLDLVDRKMDMNSILEKIRFMHRQLPSYLQDPNFSDAYCRITNGEGSVIGEGGDDIGRGGRTTVFFVDEAAYIEHYDRVEAALSQNTDTVIEISTHNGVGTRFFQKRNEGRVDVFVFDWRDDPRKTQEWYDRKKEETDSSIFAQEVDRNAMASLTNTVIKSEWIMAAVDFPMDYGSVIEAGLDVADGGADSSVYISRAGAKVLSIEKWKTSNTIQTAHKATEFARRDKVQTLKYDRVGVGSGVAATFDLATDLGFETIGVHGSDSPTEKIKFDDLPNVYITERFINKRAENWWSLRRRFQRTYEHKNGLRQYPMDELISIPNHQTLINELSIVQYKYVESGKVKIESKEDLKARGIKSPDYADALVYCYAFTFKRFMGIF